MAPPSPQPLVPRRILVSRIDNLGDVVMVLPALRWLKSQHSGLRIEMVVRDYARALTQACPWVDRVWSPEEVAKAVAAHQPAPDAVFHLQSSRALLRDCARWRIPIRVGNLLRSAHWLACNRWVCFSKRRMREHESHLSWRYFAAVFDLAPSAAQWAALLKDKGWLNVPQPAPRCEPSPLHVLVHPGSNGNGRQWPLPHFAALVGALHAAGHTVSVTGAAAERPALATWLAQLPAGVLDEVGRHSLAQFIERIASADCLVASGTGPLHLAGACGVHAVGIFPPLLPIGALRWRPIGPRVTVLQTTDQAPCQRVCSNADCACMAAVTPSLVLHAVLATPSLQALTNRA
jgi:ADP-heptose:LPS heptosyltransferase